MTWQPVRTTQQLASWLNSEAFYELMQTYRHTPPSQTANVVKAFEAVKAAIISAATNERKH